MPSQIHCHGFSYAILESNDLGKDYLDRLVVVQKSFGYDALQTSEIYTSIPQEIYNIMAEKKGTVTPRYEKISSLVERTQLRINVSDSR